MDEAGVDAAIEALRARGAPQADPVRWRFVEAFARRAAAHDGELRRLLDARLRQLLHDLDQALVASTVAPAPAAEPHARSALGELLDRLSGQHPDSEPREAHASQGQRATPLPAAPLPELKTLRLFPATWSRLAADQRLTQALAQVPDNAGPLHSQHLVHRALLLMREASPEYLQHFMAHVDALMWLEQAQAAHQRQERQEPPPARSASMSKPATRL
jgi:hypothetical protein